MSFILPGRKVAEASKAQKIIKDLDTATVRNQSFIAGFDLFGYDDDPFTSDKYNKENDLEKILNLSIKEICYF